jgi:D-sedoheptulose 7-phosphate isomerase
MITFQKLLLKMKYNIDQTIRESINVKQLLLDDKELLELIANAAEQCTDCFRNQGKVLLCGNGGSAADAQHIAAELSGRFDFDRDPLFAEALHVNSSFVTAVANDYSYEEVYKRMVKAAGKNGDVLIGISTSGNSQNIVRAIRQANELGMITIGLTGETGGKLKELCNLCIRVPSHNTARIQESHILIGHIICGIVEKNLYAG